MDRTINGYSKQELSERLSKDFEKVGKTHDGFPALTIEQYQDRINEVIGTLNYDYEVSEPKITQLGDQTTVTVKGTITVRYDDGAVFCTKSAIGSERINMIKETDKPVSLENSFKSADTDAFKACCKRLGIGDKQLRTLKAQQKGASERASKNFSEESDSVYVLKFTDKASPISDKGYKIPAKTNDGDVISVVFWNKGKCMADIKEVMSFDDFVERYSKNQITLKGKISYSNYRGTNETQLVVSELAKRSS